MRDVLSFGQVDAAHMLSTLPVAAAMGLCGVSTPLKAVSVLFVNGNVIVVNRDLENRQRQNRYPFDHSDARAAGMALLQAAEKSLRIGVPFPFSMHTELLHDWLSSMDPDAAARIEIQTIPPPLYGRGHCLW
ncbi:MAG: ABC transporter substrate-binding protein [Roseobacter sp.]